MERRRRELTAPSLRFAGPPAATITQQSRNDRAPARSLRRKQADRSGADAPMRRIDRLHSPNECRAIAPAFRMTTPPPAQAADMKRDARARERAGISGTVTRRAATVARRVRLSARHVAPPRHQSVSSRKLP
ncbi:hypothetical protein A8H37_12585 [Burkholderia thailandensis]|nr:hypothetical protein A8H37_12585 [Burkholderia thailandensis]